MKMKDLKQEALKLGAKDFGHSWRSNKRFYVDFGGKIIHFGSKSNNTFIDHGNFKLRENWKKRHSKIKLKDGRFAFRVKESPEFWSYHLLW